MCEFSRIYSQVVEFPSAPRQSKIIIDNVVTIVSPLFAAVRIWRVPDAQKSVNLHNLDVERPSIETVYTTWTHILRYNLFFSFSFLLESI